MANISVPVDGRVQFSFATAAMANHSLGRMPWDGIEQVGPDRYVVRGSWPTLSFSSAVAASTSAPETTKARSPGHALWPNLP
jgi:hypothetical protein